MTAAAASPFLPVTVSVFDANALLRHVLPRFARPVPAVSCRLHMAGVNDLYHVETGDGRAYFLKVYRAGWRTRDDVLYELSLLRHLHDGQVGVALPVACIGNPDGVLSLPALEGERQAVLLKPPPAVRPDGRFTRMPGECFVMGAALARVHLAAQNFASPHARPARDAARCWTNRSRPCAPTWTARVR
jgi:Ser/Thr protein kinase RdoA (MazF antagonist)